MTTSRFNAQLKRLSAIRFKRSDNVRIIASLLAASLTLGSIGLHPNTAPVAYAKSTVINELNYEPNRLIFNGKFSSDTFNPEIESWPSEVDGQSTIVTVISIRGDISEKSDLQNQLSRLQTQFQDIKRLAAYPTKDGFFKVILEVIVSSDALSQTQIKPVFVKDSGKQVSLWLNGYQGEGEIAPHNQAPEKKPVPNNRPQIAEDQPAESLPSSASTQATEPKPTPVKTTAKRTVSEDQLIALANQHQEAIKDIERLQKENQNLTKEIGALKSETSQTLNVWTQTHESLQAEKDKLTEQNITLNQKINALKEDLEQVQEKTQNKSKKKRDKKADEKLKAEINTLEKQLAEAEDYAKELATLQKNLEKDNQNLSEALSQEKQTVQQLSQQLKQEQAEKASQKNAVQHNEAEKFQTRIKSLSTELEALQKKLSTTEIKNQQLTQALNKEAEATQSEKELKAQAEADQKLLVESAQKMAALTKAAEVLTQQNQTLNDEVATLKADLEKANQDKQALIIKEHYLKNAEKTETTLKEKIAKLQQEIEAKNTALKTATTELDENKKLLADTQSELEAKLKAANSDNKSDTNYKQEISALEQKLGNTEQALKRSEELLADSEKRNKELEKLAQENNTLKTTLETLESSLAEKDKENERLLKALLAKETDESNKAEQAASNEEKELRQQAEALAEKLATENQKLSAELLKTQSLINQKEAEISHLKTSAEEKSEKENNNKLSKKQKKNTELLVKTTETLAKTKEELDTVRRSYDDLQDRYDSLESHAEAAIEANLKLEQKLEKAEADIKEAKSKNGGFNIPLIGKGDKTLDYNESVSVIQELKQTQKERDFFEKEASKMKQQLAKLEHDYDMPEYKPANAEAPKEPTVSNEELKALLATLANQLKETQAELATIRQVNTKALAGKEVQEEAQENSQKSPHKNNTIAVPHSEVVTAALAVEATDDWKQESSPEKMLRSLMEEHPHNVSIYLKLKELYIEQKSYADAEWVLQSLLGRNPQYHAAHYEFARLYTLWQKPDKARESLTTYKKFMPNDRNIATLERHLNKLEFTSQKE